MGSILYSIYTVIRWIFWLYSIFIVINAILSWVPALSNSVVGQWIDKVVNPYLNLFRRGPLAKLAFSTGIDFSPILALLVLYRFVGIFNQLIFKNEAILTDFLDPGKRDILKTIVGNEAFIQEFGGYEDAEKKRVYLNLEWDNLKPDDYQIIPFEIEYPEKFSQLNHSSILGTLANSGLETDTFGDIVTDGKGRWQFFAKKELSDFFIEQIDRVGNVKVKIKPISFKDVLTPQDDSLEKNIIINSLRIDAFLAGISKDSRGQIQKAIESKLVKLNWHEIQDSNIMVNVNDIVSLRHFGRIVISNISATKKGKYKVVLKLWQTKKHK